MACAAPLVAPEPTREQRKVVTVLFCDLVGSTSLGESSDPEVVRGRLKCTFEDLRSIVESHGGTVEKFVGDAVMAVFGIPASHEDDALRAVRAAAEMQGAVASHGLEARIGINTGAVVVGGEGETLVTGDAVNVAARLEQAAAAGEVLIGAGTRLLVRDAVELEPVEPLALKGKAQPVEASRLVAVIGDAAPLARHLDTPLVGRERERRRLWRDYEDAVADRTCRLFTLLGPAGIGKSRLVADFLERVGASADVLRGRCLSYGEGITYWPLVEILLPLGVEPDSVIGSSPPETQLAFRRLLEIRAAERPQVVVIDDLQWAEPVFVDLVEHVADLSRDAPIFLLCIARTELLDVRPEWGGGKVNATSLLLEPLGAGECAELIERLEAPLDADLRERITVASAGNPLYVEEMLAMVREHGGGAEIAVPPTIHALLQARIDSLDGDVRVVMERGAVEGEVFHRGTVAELSPDAVRSEVGSHLTTLVRKELIRATAPLFPEDEGFRFRHLLIRDAAYESLPKATRAELHERFADWLSTHDLVESDEIVGYHLEQAHRYRRELDPGSQGLMGLGARGAEHLAAAGRGAMERGDYRAGGALLQRAAALLPAGDERRLALAPDRCDALAESGDIAGMTGVLAEARQSTDAVLRAMVAIIETRPELDLPASGSGEPGPTLDRARAALEAAGHDEGLSLYWWAVAREAWLRCRAEETGAASDLAVVHADRAGAKRRAHEAAIWISASCVFGPMPIGEAIARAEQVGTRFGGSLLSEAHASVFLGMLAGMQGDIERGRPQVRSGVEMFRDAGLVVTAAGMSMGEAWVELWAGDLAAAEGVLRSSLELLERLDDRGYSPTVALQLADFLYQAGRYDEIEALCEKGRAYTTPDDLVNFFYLDLIEGGACARRGQHTKAEEKARRAVALADTTDFYGIRGTGRLRLAEVLALAGKTSEASHEAADGLAHYRAKGDLASDAVARERLAALDIEVAT
jgi:class 3 adenylate cyclase/tetratricopeptide (TPR) repeat protein